MARVCPILPHPSVYPAMTERFAPSTQRWRSLLRPERLSGQGRYRALLVALGGGVGVGLTFALGKLFVPASLPAIVAPIGASAVLVFAVPASPLATPRAVVLGNTLSAAVGVGVGLLAGAGPLAATLALFLALAVMAATRCLHPPGGAAALTGVLVSPMLPALPMALAFPLLPVALNSIMLVLCGIGFHRLTGHSYPHQAAPARPPETPQPAIRTDDIAAALAELDEVYDIAPEDLEKVLALASTHATRRTQTRR
ncbi:HPP family protein [Acetobacter vaccinii]|uniref:HPP family protein n=1 Tax=Acetobacter vaccinii TaxID=2592655 RepID=A0A5C1YNH3_9PROT|nr:HPP family protein [Acetobacter vaccinii]QEO17045.1 HPP family protein [Acetobacter vaccinii]